jgi:tRNA(fMet)-specific endonuclease VapC
MEYFNTISIETFDLSSYALIDTYSRNMGINMGKNDLWIAAAAHTTGATLVTTDRDFDHLHTKFIQRLWVPPQS